jgi:hypothetical protein
MKKLYLALAIITCVSLLSASAQVSIAPLSTFGVNGWLVPSNNISIGSGNPFLSTDNNSRGLAYGNGYVYLVSRTITPTILYLDPNSGATMGSLSLSGVSGGTFPINTIAVGSSGTIYVNNLTIQSTTSPLKIYSWANNAATPTVVYSGNAGLGGARVGDSLAAVSSGGSTLLALGYAASPTVTGNNGYSVVDPTASTATAVGFVGTPPNAGDFRLGITFTDSSHVWGSQGTTLRNTSFTGTSGTLLGSFSPVSTAERLMAYSLIGNVPVLAVQSTGDSHVSIYDITNPLSPVLIASGNNTTGTLSANSNGTGQVAWGDPAVYNSGNGTWTQTLYAMSSNQGIQAFVVTIPEPSSLTLLGLGAAAFAWLRRKKN